MLSFWEKESFLYYDVIVVGGGIVGLSTAVNFKERCPSSRVLVLERGVLPTGASTKNVGFLSVSTLTEVLADRKELGTDAVLSNIEKRYRGIQLLRQRLGDEAIGYEPQGGYELLSEKELSALNHLDEVNLFLKGIFGEPVFQLRPDLLRAFGFNQNAVRALLYNPFDGQVHTGKLMSSFLRYAASQGVQLITGAEVMGLSEGPSQVEVAVRNLPFRAGCVAVCTNAFLSHLLPQIRIVPARGQVFITAPVRDLPWQGTFNFEEGYNYFRNVGQRVIVGGARHTDKETETSYAFEINPGIHTRLERFLSEIIFPGRDRIEIEHRWAGIMGFREPRTPFVERISPRTVVGFGCNSMGLAMGSVIGDQAARLCVEATA